MDEADSAQTMAAAERDSAVARLRRRIARDALLVGREDCTDCGEPIEPARRAAVRSAVRCAPCARDIEAQRCS